MTTRITIVLAVSIVASNVSFGQNAIVVDPAKEVGKISPLIYGHFLEHIFDSVVDGLSGQLVRGPSFEEAPATLGPEWTVLKGPWGMDGDELTVADGGSDCHVLVGDAAWTDCTVSVEAQKIKGAEGFLILFRAVDTKNFYWWNLGGWSNSYSAVEHEVDGKRSVVVGTRSETKIEPNRWYKIEVALTDKHITCSLDGKVLTQFDDLSNGHGRVGLGSWSTDLRYRNFHVTQNSKTLFAMKGREPNADTLSPPWHKTPDNDTTVKLERTNDHPRNSQFCEHIVTGLAGGGIYQDGLAIERSVKYGGSVWLRGKGTVRVSLAAGSEVHESRFDVDNIDWKEYPFLFLPASTMADATLTLRVDGAGDVVVDECTLQRGDTPYRPAIIQAVGAIRPTFIRWPGGCFAEYYRWKDGIGPMADRVTKPNYVWGGLDPNNFGSVEFLSMCEDISDCKGIATEPVIVLNIGQHDAPDKVDSYIQEALDWLEYCNGGIDTKLGTLRKQHGHGSPFNVKYWEIGNETWSLGTAEYAARLKRFVAALRAKDPSLKFLACGSGGYDQKWNREMIDLAAESIDYLSVHQYMQGTFAKEMEDGVKYPGFLHETGKLIAASKNPNIKIAVTEWNEQSIALRTGLYAGMVLNGFERNCDVVEMASPALFIRKVTAMDWNNAFINHDSTHVFVAPNYLVMKMYRDNFAPIRVDATAPDSLNVVATHDPDSDDVIVKGVNPSETQDVVAEVSITGRDVPQFRRWRVWSKSIDDQNGFAEPEKIHVTYDLTDTHVTFPAHSATVLRTYKGLLGSNTKD